MTATETLVAHCRALDVDALDGPTLEATHRLVLDTMGTAIGGLTWSDTAEVFLGAARALDGGAEEATVLATGERVGAGTAALANGALSHSLDYDNRHSAGSLHVGSSVIVAALAAAERDGVDGGRFLEAVVAGFDVACRLGRACNPRSSHERGFHPTGTCGAFGATAAAAVVSGLDADAFGAAIGACGSLASGSYQCSLTGGWNKRLHPGVASRHGMLAVALAEHGFRGPDAPLEGDLGFLHAYADDPRPARLTADLGDPHEVVLTKLKPYPLGTFTHAPVAILLDLLEAGEVRPEAVERVVVEIPTSGAAFFAREEGAPHPTTSAEAQFDMPFAVALALCAGEAGIGAFRRALDGAYGAEFERLMAAVETVGSDELEAALPERYPARVVVELGDGRLERTREHVKGEPADPMTWPEVVGKFEDLAAELDASTRAAVVEAVADLPASSPAALLGPLEGG